MSFIKRKLEGWQKAKSEKKQTLKEREDLIENLRSLGKMHTHLYQIDGMETMLGLINFRYQYMKGGRKYYLDITKKSSSEFVKAKLIDQVEQSLWEVEETVQNRENLIAKVKDVCSADFSRYDVIQMDGRLKFKLLLDKSEYRLEDLALIKHLNKNQLSRIHFPESIQKFLRHSESDSSILELVYEKFYFKIIDWFWFQKGIRFLVEKFPVDGNTQERQVIRGASIDVLNTHLLSWLSVVSKYSDFDLNEIDDDLNIHFETDKNGTSHLDAEQKEIALKLIEGTINEFNNRKDEINYHEVNKKIYELNKIKEKIDEQTVNSFKTSIQTIWSWGTKKFSPKLVQDIMIQLGIEGVKILLGI